jgi:hypothetical protein
MKEAGFKKAELVGRTPVKTSEFTEGATFYATK